MNNENINLTAKVHFHDVDGNAINKIYCDYPDINWILETLSSKLTDEDEFHAVTSKKFPGLNGIIDISKPVRIIITMQ